MKDVYISLGFFLLSGLALCVWAKTAYEALLICMESNDRGVGGAGFLLGMVWGVVFAYLFRMFREVGHEVTEELEKARRAKE